MTHAKAVSCPAAVYLERRASAGGPRGGVGGGKGLWKTAALRASSVIRR